MLHLRLLPLAFVLLLLATGCSSPGPYPKNPAVCDARGMPRDSTPSYFANTATIPAATSGLKDPDVLDNVRLECKRTYAWASYNLLYFQAPVLSNYYAGADMYRFLWLRSFHRPVLLTLRRDADGATLRTQFLSKSPMFIDHSLPEAAFKTTGALPREKAEQQDLRKQLKKDVAEGKRRAVQVTAAETMQPLTAEQWQHFDELLKAADFWKLPTCESSSVIDGAHWLLEGHQASGHHAVSRQSPGKLDSFRATCEYLLDLSSARNEERY